MRDNSFGILRLIASLLVVYTHSFPIALGSRFHEPDIGLPFSLGTTGVFIFFAISGILVTKSFMQCENTVHFFVHRALRIFPALIVCLLVCAFIVGPLVTLMPLSHYFQDRQTWSFLLRDMLLISDTQSTLPGVFVTNPYASAVIDPIWTLPWELRAYVLLAVGGLLLSIKRKPMAGGILFALAALNAIFLMDGSKTSLFFVLFFLGGSLYLAKLHTAAALVLTAILTGILVTTHGTPMFDVFFCGWIAILVYIVGFSGLGRSRLIEKYDLSYGVYIYSFPVGQMMVFVTGMSDPWLLFALSTAIAVMLALMSWTYIEKPILSRKHAISRVLGS